MGESLGCAIGCAGLSPSALAKWAGQIRLVGSPCSHVMLRIHGDRTSLLAALTAHWAEQQLQIPHALRPVVARSAAGPDHCAERTAQLRPGA